MENKQHTAPNITSSQHPCTITILSNLLRYNSIQDNVKEWNFIEGNANSVNLSVCVSALALGYKEFILFSKRFNSHSPYIPKLAVRTLFGLITVKLWPPMYEDWPPSLCAFLTHFDFFEPLRENKYPTKPMFYDLQYQGLHMLPRNFKIPQ